MSDNQFYSEIQRRFVKMIEKDKRRKRRMQLVLFGLHLSASILAVFFTLQYAYYFPAQSEPVFNFGWGGLVLAGIVSLITHGHAVFSANITTVQDTVIESLMLLTQRDQAEPSYISNKAKRREYESVLSDDGELIHVQPQSKHN